jgi:hypothetical protein
MKKIMLISTVLFILAACGSQEIAKKGNSPYYREVKIKKGEAYIDATGPIIGFYGISQKYEAIFNLTIPGQKGGLTKEVVGSVYEYESAGKAYQVVLRKVDYNGNYCIMMIRGK